MGVGTNVQARAVALQHLDAPWRPADVAQREGRILRQGNLNGEVQIIRYVTEKSFDGYMWQTLERKAKFIAQIMRGRLDVREIEDIGDAALSYNEVKALATGNPLLIDKAEADAELTKLERAERAHHRNEDYLQRTITRGRKRAAEIGTLLPRLDQAIARRRDTRAEAFAMTVDGRPYRKRPDAGLQLKGLLQKEAAAVALEVKARGGSTRGRTIPAGELGGLPLAADIYPAFGDIRITLHYPDAPGTDLVLTLADLAKADPAGLAVQLENRLRGLEKTRTDLAAEQDRASAEADRAAAATGKPFLQAGKLDDARARVQAITEQLEAIAAEQTGHPGQETGTDPDAAAAGAGTPAASPSGQPAASSRRPAPTSPGAATADRESRPGPPARQRPAAAGHGPARIAAHAGHGSPQAAAETAAPGPPAREGTAAPAAGAAPARGRGPAQDRPAPGTGTAPAPDSRRTSAAAPARYDQSWPPGQAQEALDDAAARAARTRQVHYVYTRDNHWVCANREPPGVAWYAVNPHGSWARRIHGQTEAFDGQPTPLHLSGLGALGDAPAAAPNTPAAAAGPASQPFAGDWTGTHHFDGQIGDMRRAALDNELLLHTAQSNGEDNFTTAFRHWADDYVAENLPSDPGQAPQFTRFATAYFDDLSFAADLTAADRARGQYQFLAAQLTVPGSPERDALQRATRELEDIQAAVTGTIISAALARHGSGPLPRHMPAPAPGTADGDGQGLLPLPGDDGGGGDAAALSRVAELAGVLPAWPPRFRKPLSGVKPGDILIHRGFPGDPLTVTASPRRNRDADTTEIAGALHGPGGRTITWVYAHHGAEDPEVEFIPAGGPLTGPVPPAPGADTSPGPPAEASQGRPGRADPRPATRKAPLALPPAPAAPLALPPPGGTTSLHPQAGGLSAGRLLDGLIQRPASPEASPDPRRAGPQRPRAPLALPPGGPSGQETRTQEPTEEQVADQYDGRGSLGRPGAGRPGAGRRARELGRRISELLELGPPADRYQIGPAVPRQDFSPAVAFGEAVALATARRLSMTGEQFNVTRIPGNGEPRVIAGFLNGQALPPPPRPRAGGPAGGAAGPPHRHRERSTPGRRDRPGSPAGAGRPRIGRGPAGPRRDVTAAPRRRLRRPAAAAPACLPRRHPAGRPPGRPVRAGLGRYRRRDRPGPRRGLRLAAGRPPRRRRGAGRAPRRDRPGRGQPLRPDQLPRPVAVLRVRPGRGRRPRRRVRVRRAGRRRRHDPDRGAARLRPHRHPRRHRRGNRRRAGPDHRRQPRRRAAYRPLLRARPGRGHDPGPASGRGQPERRPPVRAAALPDPARPS